jgi:hypothetical protein
MEPHSVYFGFQIWKNTAPGFALRYTASVNGQLCSGETLTDIREMIRKYK